MIQELRLAMAACALAIAMSVGGVAFAQKQGGVLKMYIWDNPPSMSMLEGANVLAQRVTMAVFNNLIMFDQHVKQSSLSSIVPDLATGWSWNEEGTELTFPLRQGVKWHDGKPFYREGRPMHLGPVARQVERQAPSQHPEIVVSQSRRNQRERRLRGHLPSETAAASLPDDAR